VLESAALTIATTGKAGAKTRQTAVETLAVIVGAICLFGQLGALGLVGPDEPRYAWIARAMAETGDWVTPQLYGTPWFEKPVLYYWLAGLGFKVGFSAEWAARLPSALAALGAAFAIGWMAHRHFVRKGVAIREPNSTLPIFCALVFATSVAAIGFARAATPDMLFSASITAAMAFAATLLPIAPEANAPEQASVLSPFVAQICFGVFLGLGVLAKGPAAVILAGGAIAIWAALTKNWRAVLRLASPAAVFVFCVVALPWYVLCAARNPDFLHVFIFQHNFERYLTPMFQHIQPFWFFVPVALAALIPWLAFLAASVADAYEAIQRNTWRTSPSLYFACWALFPILFFSLSKSKLPSYILPGMPALALLATVSAEKIFERSRRAATGLSALIGLTWAGLILAAVLRFEKLPSYVLQNFNLSAIRIVAAALAVVIASLLVITGGKQKFAWLVALNAILIAITVEAVNIRVLPLVDPFVSARVPGTFAAQNANERFFTYKLPRAWNYGLAFYAHAELPEWTPENQFSGVAFTTQTGYNELRQLGRFHGHLDRINMGVIWVPVYGAVPPDSSTDAPVQGPLDQQR
jgi:4-amino-4-deoxy-L-arabinose transferase-like glycosyltransferase